MSRSFIAANDYVNSLFYNYQHGGTMNKLLLTLIVFFVTVSNSFAQIPTYVPKSNLVGWWGFNSNLLDQSGNGHNGVIQSGSNGSITYSNDRFGNPNSSLKFTSNSEWNQRGPYVEITNSSGLLVNSNFSICYSVKVSSQNQVGEIINKGSDDQSGTFWTRIVNGAIQASIRDGGGVGTNIDNEQWYHVVLTRGSNSILSIYVNGKMINSSPCGTIQSSLSNYYFGSMVSGGSNGSYYPFQGNIDDVGFWNRALTQEEITGLYDANNDSQIDSTTICNTNSLSGFTNNNMVTVSSNQVLNSLDNSFTVETWFKPLTPLVAGSNLIRKGGNWLIHLISGRPQGYMWFGKQIYLEGVKVEDNTWHHVALTYDGSTIRLIQDGLIVDSKPASGNIQTGSEVLAFGKYYDSPSCNCNLDEIRIWDRALTTAEIQDKMKKQLNPFNEQELLAYWRFNEGSGGTVSDVTGNGNNGILTSGIQWTKDVPFNSCADSISDCIQFIRHPQNIFAKLGDSISVISKVLPDSAKLRWQTKTSNLNWVDIVNNVFYKGASTDTLSISKLIISNHKQQFRVIATVNDCIDTSNVGTLSILDTCVTNATDTVKIAVADTLIIKTKATGINEDKYYTFLVYPNPTSTQVIIDCGDSPEVNTYSFTITNSLGQEKLTSKFTSRYQQIDISGIGGTGLYIITIKDGNNTVLETRKLLIQ